MVHKITRIFHQGKAFFAKAGSAVLQKYLPDNRRIDHGSTVPTSLRLLKQIYTERILLISRYISLRWFSYMLVLISCHSSLAAGDEQYKI